MPSAPPAPPERHYANGAAPVVSEKHERYEHISGTLAASTTFQEIGRFSGTPDSIDLTASASGMEIRLADVARNEVSSYLTTANVTIETHVSRRIVEARDPAGTGGQTVRAIGKWAEQRA